MSRAPLSLAALFLAAMVLGAPSTGRADEVPNPELRLRIEEMLRANGFVRWGEIEREDEGRTWEIEDAYTADGREYEIKLDASTLRLLEIEED